MKAIEDVEIKSSVDTIMKVIKLQRTSLLGEKVHMPNVTREQLHEVVHKVGWLAPIPSWFDHERFYDQLSTKYFQVVFI